jgi:molybdopterin converting factor small subunit
MSDYQELVKYINKKDEEINSLKSQLATEIANREALDSLCANYKAQLAERNEWLREARPWIKWAMNNHHGDMGQANQWYEKTKDLK